jgi:hypothetical protein
MSRPCPCVPWDALPEPRARAVVGVLTDIDDTLTEAGVIAPRRCGRWMRCTTPGCR